jgi:hypothetical protein
MPIIRFLVAGDDWRGVSGFLFLFLDQKGGKKNHIQISYDLAAQYKNVLSVKMYP